METNPKKRLKVLTNEKKIAIIKDRKENDTKNKDLAKKYGIKECTISSLWKNRAKYENISNINKKSKKIVKVKFEEVENAAKYAFDQWRSHNIPVTGLMIRTKAKKFAEMLGILTFKGKY